MMKKTLKILGIVFLVNLLYSPLVLASFSDLHQNHQNYNAIIHLKNNEVIEGYADGTFKPEKQVNRVEFLKIIMEGSKIRLDELYPTPFPDVNHISWYAPYVKKAYKEGWINGYPDGTFKPTQTINKVEALKILGEVQDWQLPTNITTPPYQDTPITRWYTPYVSYAKERNFLEGSSSTFSPGALMTRANISEVIYRTMTSDFVETPQEPEEPATANYNPQINFETIETTFFRDITLTETLPNHFYKNEVYFIEGTTNFSNTNKVTIILEGEGKTRRTFSGKTSNRHFSIPIYFSEEGEFLLGIIPGESGTGSATKISVITSLPKEGTSATPPQINNQQIYFSDGKTIVDFPNQNNTIKKIHFNQNNQEVTYITRQNKNQIPIQYRDFENFQKSTVTYSISAGNISSSKPLEISSGFVQGGAKTFQATEHHFSEIKQNEITTTPPETLNSLRTISFSGTAKTDLRYNAYVVKPNGFVENVPLSTSSEIYSNYGETIIKAGGNFTYTYTPATSGIYIVEINNLNGEPSLNHTVYVNTGIPLLPDFFDINERKAFEGTLNLNSARQELLNLINKSRMDHGLSSVAISSEINTVAQNHSQDMADNNYFSHINLQGQTPEDRRIEAGVKTPIGENLAKDTSVITAHYGLMRSASHRQNLLTPEWTRVGLGIAQKNGQLFVTQNFSISELNTSDLTSMESELFTQINNSRSSKQLSTLSQSEKLRSASEYINTKIIQEGATLNNALFQEALDHNEIFGHSELIGRISSSWSTIITSIVNDETSINKSNWKTIGINIQIDHIGNLHTIIILNR